MRTRLSHNSRALLVISGIVLGVLVLVLVAAAIPLFNRFKPSSINFTASEYQAALKKWQDQHIIEYEISTHEVGFNSGDVTLHVSNNGNILLLGGPPPTPEMTPEPSMYTFYKGYTVEGMFKKVAEILSNDEPHAGPLIGIGNDSGYVAYTVDFDPELGYPTRIVGKSVTKPGAYADAGDVELRVINLKIIKQDK